MTYPILSVYSGVFNLGAPVFKLKDITISLSRICRYNGHITNFYSVAEHCYLVGKVCNDVLKVNYSTYLAALLHDASEAYLGDLPAPIKNLPELALYRELENNLLKDLYQSFGLSLDQIDYKAIDLADLAMRRIEAKALLKYHEWAFALPDLGLDEEIFRPAFWTSEQAEKALFLAVSCLLKTS